MFVTTKYNYQKKKNIVYAGKMAEGVGGVMANWEKIKIGLFLSPYRIEHIVQDDKNYRQVTISKNHGISFRGVKNGKNIGRKRQFILDLQQHPNTVVFTRQGVLDGAIGIAPIEVDKCIVTENMPMMSVDTSVIEMTYLKKLLVSDYLYQKIRLLKIVGSAQKSIHERDLLNVEIKLPNKKIQHDICNKFTVLDMEHSELEIELTHQQTLLKKLRQQILQEAIEGKLTKDWRAENPDVESASELLKRIQAEKAQLIKDKKIKKQKPVPPIREDEMPFELPDGWVWCRLGGVAIINPRNFVNDNLEIGFTPMPLVSSKLFEHPKYELRKWGDVKKGFTHFADADVVVAKITPCFENSKAGIIQNFPNGIGAGTTELHVIRILTVDINSHYVYFLLKTSGFLETGKRLMKGSVGQKRVPKDYIDNLLLPLPPLPEQTAIVAKVEKLLTLCDQLQTQITTNQSHAKQLMQAVLKEAFSQNSQESKQTAM